LSFGFVFFIVYLPSRFSFISSYHSWFFLPSPNIVFLLVWVLPLYFGGFVIFSRWGVATLQVRDGLDLLRLGRYNIVVVCLLVRVWMIGFDLSHFCSCSHSCLCFAETYYCFFFNCLMFWLSYQTKHIPKAQTLVRNRSLNTSFFTSPWYAFGCKIEV